MVTTPLYFVRSGYTIVNNGRLKDTGIYSYDWSKTSSSKIANGATVSSAYYFSLSATGVNSSNGPGNRWYGFPLR